MRLLIFGGFGDASIENEYYQYWLNEAGIDLIRKINRFEFTSSFTYLDRALIRCSPWLCSKIRGLNSRVMAEVIFYDIDILVIFKGMELAPKVLRALRARKVKLVCYNPDHPFIYSGRGSGNRWMKKSIKFYDLYLTYDNSALWELRKMGVSAEKLSFGCESRGLEQEYITAKQEELRVCFVGNPDPSRLAFVVSLSKLVAIDVYGHSWEQRLPSDVDVNCFPAVYGEEFWRILSKYRVQLNLMRVHNNNSQNMRTFSVPGCGGIMLAPRTEDHLQYFVENEEVFLFDGVLAAADIATKILGLSYDEALAIRKRARLRCRRNKYGYEWRAKEFISFCSRLLHPESLSQ